VTAGTEPRDEPAVRIAFYAEDKDPSPLGILLKKFFHTDEYWNEASRPRAHFDEGRSTQGNQWKNAAGRVDLVRDLATKLRNGSFVIFHYDGDKPWAERPSDTDAQFNQQVRVRVQQLLTGPEPRRNTSTTTPTTDDPNAIDKLIVCVPYYSLEAWLYQATDAAVALCNEHHRRRDRERFLAWGEDRSLLDEVSKPKEATCLGSGKNEELAAKVPLKDVVAAGKSLAAFRDALLKHPSLRSVMRETVLPVDGEG
jgi:hypothetical protein